jgi:glycosyltransferase involved in cell wall biosynthesis
VTEQADEGLIAKLEIGLPDRLAVGRGTAFVVAGYAYHPGADTRGLAVEVGGVRTGASHIRMPRADVFDRLGKERAVFGQSLDGAGRLAYRSGFVAVPTVAPRERLEEAEVRLVATLADGREARASLGRLRLDPALERPDASEPVFPRTGGARVAICMATYNPPPELLQRQLDSLRKQTHRNWVCVISDDHSRSELYRALLDEVGGDDRFAVSGNDRRLGFYGNFERALAMVPPSADYVTLCDQDDRWNPDKLELLLGRMDEGVELAYSDARIVDPEGRVIHPSYWTARPTNYENLGSLLIANTVTGAASLFRRQLLEDLLPFPPRVGNPYHDHWLALVALARGRIAYVEEPLYDYVQHEGAVIGHAGANPAVPSLRRRLLDRVHVLATAAMTVYYYGWTQKRLFGEVLRLRCWDRMAARKRRALRRFLSSDTSIGGLVWLLGRRVRRLWGRTETMDLEAHLGGGILCRRIVSLAAGRRRPSRVLRADASIPPDPARQETRR